MSRHRMDSPSAGDHLIVPLTSDCVSQASLTSTGSPRLTIDYGGAALVLDGSEEPQSAEMFALALARESLDFAENCRYLPGDPHV